ncbi:prolipoprotein diacylglyceryl transferase [Candidatus Uhrbacteria bacterium]|nr:prolipoprotein diacylglyceryl transferase [Candidatus Uhrbacteria bacterium]
MNELFLLISPSAYGFIFACAGLSAYCVSRFFVFRFGTAIARPFSFDIVFLLLVVAGGIGGRALFILYNLSYFFENPSEIPAIWHGGWVWHGALIGGALGLFFYSQAKKISFLLFADLLAPGVVLAQSIGRWGNYFNQELYGLPANAWWAIPISEENRVAGFEAYTYFHPTFLYESLWDFGLFVLLFVAVRKMYRQRDRMSQVIFTLEGTQSSGTIFALYLILYSLGRFFIEFFRIDSVPVFIIFRLPQWFSVVFVLIGAYILLRGLQRRKKVV